VRSKERQVCMNRSQTTFPIPLALLGDGELEKLGMKE